MDNFNFYAPTYFAQIAVRVWGCQMDFNDPENTAKEGIEALRSFLISIGMPIVFSIGIFKILMVHLSK